MYREIIILLFVVFFCSGFGVMGMIGLLVLMFGVVEVIRNLWLVNEKRLCGYDDCIVFFFVLIGRFI